MSGMHRFVRKIVLPLVIGAAALTGGYFALADGGAQPGAESVSVAKVITADDLGWA